MRHEKAASSIRLPLNALGKIKIPSAVSEVMSADGVTEHMTKIKTVKDRLLKDYDRTIRPTMGESNTTEVRVGFIPRQIIHFDEEVSILSLDSVIWMTWTDSRLKWETSEYSGLLQIPTNFIWLPDLTVHNSHSRSVNPAQDVLAVVEPSGKVYWVPPVLTQTTCASDAINYPQDDTTCKVTFGSWAHDGWEIDFQNDDHLYMAEFANINPRWELIEEKARLHRNVEYYECCPEPYLSVEVILPLRRRPPPEIEATRAPCILTTALALAIFWLPPDSNKKLPFGGALFTILCLLLVFVAWNTKHPLAVTYA
ncbi:neuronal acetylcholine receptor subunit alpha-7-like, partial [Uloborus diversus]|uniref:neuronal acetylcholine receptor subunit alpha-7-like n=1 Tax=Uloborus diversus TaxID=327109 RepID=UPI00240924FF